MTQPRVAVVDSGVANLTSVMAALQRLNADAEVTSDATRIKSAERVIIPGVGAARPAMAQIHTKGLTETLRGLTQPVLGICLGMQLLFGKSFEGKEPVECLGVLPGDIRMMKASPDMPVPHMGWNQLTPVQKDHKLLRAVPPGSYVYFVHSFMAPVSNATIASTDYGERFTAVAGVGNFFGCQFHPERSGTVGSRILENFLSI